MLPLEDLAAAQFEPLVGSTFQLDDGAGTALELVLFEVQQLLDARRTVDGAARPGTRAFALAWHGPRTPVLPQGIRRLAHAELGELEPFLVPIGPDAVGMRYQAVFY
jgi:hypothetical protein